MPGFGAVGAGAVGGRCCFDCLWLTDSALFAVFVGCVNYEAGVGGASVAALTDCCGCGCGCFVGGLFGGVGCGIGAGAKLGFGALL